MNWLTILQMLTKHGCVCIVRDEVEDDGGGDNVDIVDDGGEESEEEESEDDEDEGDEPEDEETEDEEDEEGGGGAQKRIRELVAKSKAAEERVKELEKQLEDAKRLGGDDGRAIMSAAEASGILPSLMTAEEAKAFTALKQYPAVIERYRDWLDDHEREDELDLGGGETMSYSEVKKRVRKLATELDDLKDRYSGRRKELEGKVREIFETGVAAVKAGWKKSAATPGEKTSKAKRVPPKDGPKRGNPKVMPVKGGRTKADWGSVNSDESLARMILKATK